MTSELPTRWVFILFWVVLFTACDNGKTPPAARPAKSTSATRIVSLAPSVTETLFAVGAGSKLVGVTRFCDYPKEATALPKVGGLTDVDVEIVLSLRPDLVVGVSSETSAGLARTLQKAKIETLFLPVETFGDVQASMIALGERVGARDAATKLAQAVTQHDVKASAAPPRVLVLFGREPWIAAGPNTFADEMITRAGGINALADLDAPYPTLDVERLGALQADVVIDTSWGTEDTPVPLANPATVVRLDPALIRPGPRLANAMLAFRKAIADAEAR